MTRASAIPAERLIRYVFQLIYRDYGNEIVAKGLHIARPQLTGKALEPYNKARPRRLRQQEAKSTLAACTVCYELHCLVGLNSP